jgi:hypothetical protein
MTSIAYDRARAALLVIDPYNDLASPGPHVQRHLAHRFDPRRIGDAACYPQDHLPWAKIGKLTRHLHFAIAGVLGTYVLNRVAQPRRPSRAGAFHVAHDVTVLKHID